MLNDDLGTRRHICGRTSIETRTGKGGHAVYGPYERLTPGRYAVEFHLSTVTGQEAAGDPVCATLDVAIHNGDRVLTSRDVMASEISGGRTALHLTFELTEIARVEFRVGISGAVPLIIDDHRTFVRLSDGNSQPEESLAQKRFPQVSAESPVFLRSHEHALRHYYERGVGVCVREGGVVLDIRGVSFHAREWDDLNFINEIFFESAYGIKTGTEACVIDIGMNIGFSSMLLATNEQVKEIHAFEPFRETYDRAIANLALNPTLAAKIHPHNIGLSDQDEDATITVADTHGDSGGASTRSVDGGRPVHIVLKNAASILRPIITAAKTCGRQVILKVDCEGGEFPIFRVLEEGGLLKEITAFMVEWHRMFEDKNEDDLIEPLKRAGFVVFDLTRPTGNGFFYAAKVEPVLHP